MFALKGGKIDLKRVSGCRLSIILQKVLSNQVYLLYLSLQSTDFWIGSSIQKLEILITLKLETFVLVYSPPWLSINILSKLRRLQHLYLPEWKLPRSGKISKSGPLRHFDLPYWELPSSGKIRKVRFNGLSKLETLKNFDTCWCEIKDLPNLIRLQKLELQVEGNYNDVEETVRYLSSLPRLRYLTLKITVRYPGSAYGADTWRQLFWNLKFNLLELRIYSRLPELVKIFVQQQQQLDNTPVTDVSLICITSLYLRDSCLLEDPMPVSEKIPTLRVLLLDRAYVGKEILCSAIGFPKLTCLELKCLPYLEKWRVEEGSMPILQHLRIFHCCKLEELPEGLRFLNSLQTLI